MGANEVKPSSIKAHEQEKVLPAIHTVPALAEDTTGIKLAGKAEKAATAKSKALISAAQNKVMHGHEVKMLPQKGK